MPQPSIMHWGYSQQRARAYQTKLKEAPKAFIFPFSIPVVPLNSTRPHQLHLEESGGWGLEKTGKETERENGTQRWEKERVFSCLWITTSHSLVGDNNAASTQTHNLLQSTCILTGKTLFRQFSGCTLPGIIPRHFSDMKICSDDKNEPDLPSKQDISDQIKSLNKSPISINIKHNLPSLHCNHTG